MNTLPFADSATIEGELQRLWQETAEMAPGGQAVTRALTLNLIARATDPAMAERMSAVVRDLVASHPNRTLLAICRPEDGPPRIDAWVQANCLLSAPGVPQVCGEQISIDARGAVTAQIASLILALLAPDLPVVLWLPGPAPFDDPLLPRLLGVIDRLIIDSRELSDPVRDLGRMAAFDRDPGSPSGVARQAALSDLGWAALTPWRELAAQFFDTRPLVPHLRRLDQVDIGYVPVDGRPNPLPGLLLAGWLAACLDWTPLEEAVSIEGAALRLHLRRPAVGVGPRAIRLVTIIITPVITAADAAPGLAMLRLRALDGVSADFQVQRVDEQGHILTTAEVAGHPPVRRLTRCVAPSLADLLAAELRLLSRDAMFSAALQRAALFAAQIARLGETLEP
ncbi:MAG: glucose-6-phosphate dehydrogenase assembly protein OpcA [Chloroflexaceae bacterium]